MTGPYADIGRNWAAMVDATADWQADLLRRAAGRMADALDREARRAVEGARDWRNSETRRDHDAA